ncbi:MAG TPA: hypothetical protein VKI19_07650 [Acidimicrobiales bacterium]|nr:hypothetical protein [Acidimicrobiales bacterium]
MTDRLPPCVEGVAPDGTPVRVDLGAGRTVLWFLTSSCRPCRAVWPTLGAGDVAVTPDAATESRRRVSALAPAAATVVMSSAAWFAFGAGPAPWRVVVEEGVVVEAGSGQAGP